MYLYNLFDFNMRDSHYNDSLVYQCLLLEAHKLSPQNNFIVFMSNIAA